MPRAYSYLRFSTPEQAKGDSARRQSALAASYAERHGLELDDTTTYKDAGISAYRGKNAEDGRLGDFLLAVKRGIIPQGSYLLVESLDRISRQAVVRALDTLRALVGAGITLVTLDDGAVYTRESIEGSVNQLLMALFSFARANEESVMKGARVRAAWDRKKREASTKPLTKVCPAWLQLSADRTHFEVIGDRGEIVRRIFELAAAGAGQHSIAAALNADGVPPFGDGRRKPGLHWHRSYIAKIIASDAALGTYVPHSGGYEDGKFVRTPWEPVLGYYPAVTDHETVRRARLVTGPGENPKRGRHAASPVRNVLAGLARCPLCQGTMTRVSKGSSARAGRPYLVCARAKSGAGCEYRAIRYDLVEHALRTRADELVYKDTLEDTNPRLDELHEQRDEVAKRIENLVTAVEEGGSTLAMRQRLGELEPRLREIEAAIQALLIDEDTNREPLVEKRMEDLRAALEADPFEVGVANTAFRLCALGVEVDPRAGHLYVRWRHGGTTPLIFMWPTDGSEV